MSTHLICFLTATVQIPSYFTHRFHEKQPSESQSRLFLFQVVHYTEPPSKKSNRRGTRSLDFYAAELKSENCIALFPAHFPSSQKTFYCALTEGQWLSLLYSSTMVN